MANRLTRIPDGTPPPLPTSMGAVVKVADLTMWLMYSRPSTGSLAKTWVTPATIMLVIPLTVMGIAFSALTVASADSVLRVAFALALAAISLGALAVSAVGVAQRLVRIATP